MSDSHKLHVAMWRRLREAFSRRGIDVSGNPTEIAGRVRGVIDGNELDRFLKNYYLERQYAGGTGGLSDSDAEALVRSIEAKLEQASQQSREGSMRPEVVPRDQAPASVAREARLPIDALQEAEAYGEEHERPSMFVSLKKFFEGRRAQREEARAEARREAGRQAAQNAERERMLALEQAREEEERRRREREEDERRAAERERQRQLAEKARAEQRAKDEAEAERKRKELEEQRAREEQARQQALAESQQRAERERLEALERARTEEERRRKEKEEEERLAAEREREQQAEERARAERLARELSEAERKRQELEERRAQEAFARRQSAVDQLASADEALRSGDRSGAILLFEQVTAALPNDAAGWFALAWAYGLDQRYRPSTDAYRRGLVLEPGNKVAWNNLGRDLRRLKQNSESEAALRKALEIDADYVTARANLGSTLRESGNFKGASESFRQVVASRPEDSAGWYWLGFCHQQLREWDNAQRALARAVELDAGLGDAWRRLGDCLRALGRRDEAKAAHQKADALSVVRKEIGIAELGLAIGVLLLGYISAAAPSEQVAFGTIVAYGVLVWRLKLTIPQLFVVAMAAMVSLTIPFTEHIESAHIGVAVLLGVTAIVAQVWRRAWR